MYIKYRNQIQKETESNTEREKVQKDHTSKNIAKPLVISLKIHSNLKFLFAPINKQEVPHAI
jgi:hypothetical protein